MTMPPPVPDGQYSNKMSTGTKVLIGCGIGCATIIGLVLIVVGFAGWWFFSTEDQVPTERILNTGSSAAFRLEDISQNQELMLLCSDVFKELQRINRNRFSGQMPESFEKFQKYFEGQQDPTQLISIFSPKEATASMSFDSAGKPVFVMAANFGTGTRMVKMFLNAATENEKKFQGEKISTAHGDLFVFDQNKDWNSDKSQKVIVGFYEGTFIFSNDTETAVSSLADLADESNTGKLNETLSDPYYRLRRKNSLAYGVLEGELLKNTNSNIGMFNGELGSEMKRAEISLDKLSSENGILNLRIDWNNKEAAAKAKEVVDKIKPGWITEAEKNGFDMEVMDSLEDEQLDVQFNVNNLKDSLLYLMQKGM